MNETRHDFDLPEGPRGPEELLTAYLFEELAPEERAELEQRLAQEPELAERLEGLRGTLSLLQQAALDAGPSQLSGERRHALRAEAIVAQTASATLGADAEQRDFAPVLQFPWLRAAAAGLIVTASVVFYQQSGMPQPELGLEADAPEMESLVTMGYLDPESVEQQAGRDSLREIGYLDTSTSNAPAEQEPRGNAATETLSVFERGLLSQLGYSGNSGGGGAADSARTKQQGDLMAGLSGVSGDPSVAGELSFDAAGAWSNIFGRDGGTFRGPGDSVPPGAGAPATSSTPATPATPSTPGATALSKFSPPRVETVDPSAGFEVKLADQLQLTEESLEARTRRGLDRNSLSRKMDLGEELYFLDSAGEAQTSFDLGLLATGFGDQMFGLDAGNGEDLQRQLGQLGYLQDGYGRRHQRGQIITHIRPIHEDETPRDMFFRYYGDNAFVPAAQDHMSTFAVDVDTASYPLVRNYLTNGQLPPRASVRTEEVVNYFDQGLLAPTDDIFAVQLDSAPTPYGSNTNNLLLRVGVKAIEVSREERLPMNVVFVVDKSGSMREQNRLGLVQRSLELLLDQMRDDDKIGIVSFDTNGHIVQESVQGRDRWKAREALRTLTPGGSTNAAEGLFLGYEMIDRNFIEGGINRLVLASDGVANTGQTDQQRILEEVADFTARRVDLTTVGVGMGNHNDVFLEQLADKGNGSCHYVDGFEEAKRVFLDEFAGTMQTVARDVKIQVEFDPSRVLKWRQLGYENRSLTHAEFRDDTVDAGEVGAGHEIVALYELELASDPLKTTTASAESLATVRMRWQPDPAFALSLASVQKSGVLAPAESAQTETRAEPKVVERSWSLQAGQIQTDWSETTSRFRLAAVAAQYAEFLRRSYHVRGDSYDRLETDVDLLVAELPGDEQVGQLRDLIRRTRDLVRYREPGSELWKLIEESRRITMLQQELRGKKVRNAETEELLVELLKQNEKLEERIRVHLEGGRD
jgi:Ca-activated chloride channel homolog